MLSLIFTRSLKDLHAGDMGQKALLYAFFIAPSRNLITTILHHDLFLSHHNNMDNES